jgi:hypothetical protein
VFLFIIKKYSCIEGCPEAMFLATFSKAVIGPSVASMQHAVTALSLIKGIVFSVNGLGGNVYEMPLFVFLKTFEDVVG